MDVATLLVVSEALATAAALVMLVVQRTRRTYSGFGWWTAGIGCFAVGSALLRPFAPAPPVVVAVLSGGMSVAGFAFLLHGMRVFRGYRPGWVMDVAILGAFFAAAAAPGLDPAGNAARVVVYSSFVGALAVATSVITLGRRPSYFGSSDVLLAFWLGALGLLALVRALVHLADLASAGAPGAHLPVHDVHGYYLLAQSLTIQLVTLTLFSMTSQRLEHDYDRARDELLHSRDDLEQTVRARTAELARARDAAEAANRAEASFVADMSHEIRTPMNSILGLAHLALRTELSPRQRDYVEKIRRSSQHLLGIVNNILDFSKIEAGALSLERVAFELQSVIDDVNSVVAVTAAGKNLEFVVDVDADVPPRLVGDPLRIGQVLLNYANNAVKFTDRGRITLSVHVERRDASEIVLRFVVRDTGIGIDEQQQAHLFQSFQQGEASMPRRYGGSGLGLVIAKRLAEAMGGEVGAASAPNEGSSFWFTARLGVAPEPASDAPGGDLSKAAGVDAAPPVAARPAPAAFEPAAAPPATDPTPASAVAAAGGPAPAGTANDAPPPLTGTAAAPASAPLDGVRILLAEDNELNQEVAIELLQDMGATVDLAENGAIAVAKVGEGHHYDLVLMDMQMPVMDGLTATREIRRRFGPQHLPIVAMTANAMASDRERCLAAGMNDHTAKPIDPELLLAKLCQWLPATTRRRAAPSAPSNGIPDGAPAAPDARGAARAPEAADRRAAAEIGTLPAELFAIPELDAQRGLRQSSGRDAVYASVLRKFTTGQIDAPTRIRAALADADWAGAERIAHTLKGTAAQIGAEAIRGLAANLEQALRGRDATVARHPALAELGEALPHLARAISAALDAGSATSGSQTAAAASSAATTAREAEDALAGLVAHLRADDLGSMQYFAEHERALCVALGPAYAAVAEAVGDCDFPGALAAVEAHAGSATIDA